MNAHGSARQALCFQSHHEGYLPHSQGAQGKVVPTETGQQRDADDNGQDHGDEAA